MSDKCILSKAKVSFEKNFYSFFLIHSNESYIFCYIAILLYCFLDQNGIVQGEFGFITADGVYHVTVYATDENGNFKILRMRNLRISARKYCLPF